MCKFMTISKAAEVTGMPAYRLRQWVKRREIRFCRSGNRHIINLDWLEEDLAKMAAENMVDPEDTKTEYGQLRKIKY